MIRRTTTRSVTFEHPFTLSGIDEVQPAGTYTVETDEELIQALSFPAYRSTGTWIRLPSQGRAAPLTQAVSLTPVELDEVLAKDAITTRVIAAEAASRQLPPDCAALPHIARMSSTLGTLKLGFGHLLAWLGVRFHR